MLREFFPLACATICGAGIGIEAGTAIAVVSSLGPMEVLGIGAAVGLAGIAGLVAAAVTI